MCTQKGCIALQGSAEPPREAPGNAWGASGVAEALHTLSSDVARMQGILPELSPRDRWVLQSDSSSTQQYALKTAAECFSACGSQTACNSHACFNCNSHVTCLLHQSESARL